MNTPGPSVNISNYEFTPTQDWFSPNTSTWKNLFRLVSSKEPRALEIGSWEGRSAVFLLTTLCATSGELVCIDHFDLMNTPEGRERYRKITHNIALTGRPARVIPQFSFPALSTLLHEEMKKDGDAGFDWIYVDGSHRSDDTLLDGELAWRLARQGCIIIFDDYNWQEQPIDSPYHPRRGIDAFLDLHAGEYQRLSTNPEQYQMVLQKTISMRIGFLSKEERVDTSDAFGYGMSIALCIDSAYAMAAAVTLRSIVDNVQGRITLYIIDCGLLATDKLKIETSFHKRQDTTIVFVELPSNSLTSKMGAVWAKVDMMKCLPVERVLYLDADVLVRKDLGDLWEIDLCGQSLAAAPDVGCPMGHDEIPRREYFNAGVLILDLSKIRSTLPELESLCSAMKNSRFREQDALNIHFHDDWVSLSLTWNAQGLGTYAECSSIDRERLSLSEMEDPAIVHFTGPVHPSLGIVLSPWAQPYTAKPWGYAGAPGHPYAREWWDVLETTTWRGWRRSSEYAEVCDRALKEAWKAAQEELHKRLESGWGDASCAACVPFPKKTCYMSLMPKSITENRHGSTSTIQRYSPSDLIVTNSL